MKSNGYIAAFGLGPGVPLLNRAKGIVLITYCGGLLAIALVRKPRRDRYLFALLMLTLIYFVVLFRHPGITITCRIRRCRWPPVWPCRCCSGEKIAPDHVSPFWPTSCRRLCGTNADLGLSRSRVRNEAKRASGRM